VFLGFSSEDDEKGIAVECACYGNTLALSGREIRTTFANLGLE